MDNRLDQSGRVEDDFSARLTPVKGTSYRRLSTSLPMAIVAMLVVATVAFGATVVRPLVVGPNPSATPVDVGDDNPDATPTAEITDEPTDAPTSEPTDAPTIAPSQEPGGVPGGNLDLTAKLSGSKVVLTWSKYTGEDFAYYKVVRSADASASWPLGEDDSLVAAIDDVATVTFTDCPATGKTWSWQVFAVKATDDGYQVLDSTNLVTLVIPKPTPKPTTNCGIGLSKALVEGHTYKFSWTKYTCGDFDAYVLVKSQSKSVLNAANPVDAGAYVIYDGDGRSTEFTVPEGPWYYRVLVWTSQENACNGGTVLARSNIVTINYAKPVPTEKPTEAPAE